MLTPSHLSCELAKQLIKKPLIKLNQSQQCDNSLINENDKTQSDNSIIVRL